MGAPPGGPLRTTPPEIKSVTPDSGAVNVRDQPVVFEFDEVVNERAGSSGELSSLFLISPRTGAPRVSWKRNRIEVRPKDGFKPNTAYSVTLLPGLSDLRNNVMKTGRTVVFSTGPTIPSLAIHGRVFDWSAERPAPLALIDVIRRPDSLPYIGAADSTGQFIVGPLTAGTYTVRATTDNNRNHTVDRDEPWDSVTVQLTADKAPFLELLAAPRDTIAPRLLTVTVSDSLHLLASFDRPLDPTSPITASNFRIVRTDSTPQQIASVMTSAAADSLKRAAAADSVRRDTTAVARAARDSAALRQLSAAIEQVPRPSRPAPPRDIVVTMRPETPLKPGSYRVSALNIRGLAGKPRSSDRILTVARPDSTARPRP